MTRSLPIRFEPMEGEAIDSYLEAYAARLNTPWHDFCDSIHIDTTWNELSKWVIQLSDGELSALQAATGVSPERAQGMTLSAYDGRAVRIDPGRRNLVSGFPWGYTSTCRFCPHCLVATGGRWQLKWRLSWSFACLDHSCLLAECCPTCTRPHRTRPHLGVLVPRPGRCANPRPGSSDRMIERCDANLSSAPVQQFEAGHSALRAQQVVYELIEDTDPGLAVYGGAKHASAELLTDIRAIARRALMHPIAVADAVPADLLSHYMVDADRRQPTRDPSLAAPRQPVAVAVGVTAAVSSLSQPNIHAAGESMRWVARCTRKPNVLVIPTTLIGRAEMTSTLTSIFLSAMAPVLGPTEQLRYCIATEPKRPLARSSSELERRSARIPTMLWPAWSIRLCVKGLRPRLTRQCLSTIIAYVGSQLTFEEAARLVQASAGKQTVSPVVRALYANEWTAISTALTRLAEYLTQTETPIDYRRRRRLNYSTLLPDELWLRLYRRHTRVRNPVNGRIARAYLFERLSGLPASVAPGPPANKSGTLALENFPRRLNLELRESLDDYCIDWLRSKRIACEPVTWHPDLSIVDDLELPGPDPRRVDLARLHDLALERAFSPQAIAEQLNTSIDVVRYLLDEHPVARVRGA
jgi:TniQ